VKSRRLIFAVLATLVVPAVAGGSAGYGVAIRSAIVNPDRSVTIEWSLENASVFNAWIAVNGSIVRTSSDRATRFTTRPLSRGSHTIRIEVHEMFETYVPPAGVSCREVGGHWLCSKSWRAATSVSVLHDAPPSCLVPRVVGLRLGAARTRISNAQCSLGVVERVRSRRPAGTVLGQYVRPSRRLPEGTAIKLVVSKGLRAS